MKQKLLRMRHAWYLLAACLTLLIPWGGEMQAAPSPQQTSVRVENVTSLKGLIQEIESQTSYRISYQGNLAACLTLLIPWGGKCRRRRRPSRLRSALKT
jgi:hypothetical protein